MDRRHDIYLAPGFLGFGNLGRITYFGHVRRVLSERLTKCVLEPRIPVMRALATAGSRGTRRQAGRRRGGDEVELSSTDDAAGFDSRTRAEAAAAPSGPAESA
jgi:hypothetical protein